MLLFRDVLNWETNKLGGPNKLGGVEKWTRNEGAYLTQEIKYYCHYWYAMEAPNKKYMQINDLI